MIFGASSFGSAAFGVSFTVYPTQAVYPTLYQNISTVLLPTMVYFGSNSLREYIRPLGTNYFTLLSKTSSYLGTIHNNFYTPGIRATINNSPVRGLVQFSTERIT